MGRRRAPFARRDAARGQILGQRPRAIPLIEATRLGLDIRVVVTNLAQLSAILVVKAEFFAMIELQNGAESPASNN